MEHWRNSIVPLGIYKVDYQSAVERRSTVDHEKHSEKCGALAISFGNATRMVTIIISRAWHGHRLVAD